MPSDLPTHRRLKGGDKLWLFTKVVVFLVLTYGLIPLGSVGASLALGLVTFMAMDLGGSHPAFTVTGAVMVILTTFATMMVGRTGMIVWLSTRLFTKTELLEMEAIGL